MPRSQTEKLWLTGGGLVAFVLLLIGYFFFISPQRSETSDLQSQVDSTRSQNVTLRGHVTALQQQSRQMPKFQATLESAQQALPTTSGLSDFLRTVQAIGNSTLTDVSSLSVGAPVDVTAISSATSGTTGSTSPAPSASPSASPGTAATPQSGGVYGLSITAQIAGTPTALNRFLDQLQSVQPRAVLITQISEGSSSSGTGSAATTTLQLTMQAFVAPTDAGEKADLAAASGR